VYIQAGSGWKTSTNYTSRHLIRDKSDEVACRNQLAEDDGAKSLAGN